jgi:putative spermidine/putrescine transport system permease protein
MRRAHPVIAAFSVTVLLVLLWPLFYAGWISFTPGEMLEPPTGTWSLRWYRLFFTSPQWLQGMANSLLVAALTVFGSVVCGTGVALAVTRWHFRGARWLSMAVLLPFMRALGLWGTLSSIAAAHSLWSLPVVFLVVRSALQELDPDLERAARGLGASASTVFVRVTLPLILPAVAAGATMAFVLSVNEFVMALFLGTPQTETLPKVIWPNLRYTLSPLVAAASGVFTLVTVAGLLVAWLLLPHRRR